MRTAHQLIPLLLLSVLIFGIARILMVSLDADSKAYTDETDKRHSYQPGWQEAYPKISPFTEVESKDDGARVVYEGQAYDLVSINGLPTRELLDFCKNVDRRWQKLFAEDLVAVLSAMKRPPKGTTVELVLKDSNGATKSIERAEMSRDNRQAVWMARNMAIGQARQGLAGVERFSRLSPFTDLRYEADDKVSVKFQGRMFDLVSIDAFTTKQLLQASRKSFGPTWQKRFAEDLVEVMEAAGSRPGDTVKLVLGDAVSGEQVTIDRAPMTAENRQHVYRNYRRWLTDLRRIMGTSGLPESLMNTMKALEKERSRRYETASAFADDVHRFPV